MSGLNIRVTGGARLQRTILALKEVGAEGLGKGMAAGMVIAARPLEPAVRAAAQSRMPSGYASTLSKSLKFRTTIRSFKYVARVTWRVHGDGQSERRDVPALNRGILRHPVYGRTRRLKHHARHKATSLANPWVAQRVRPGFVDDPLRELGQNVAKEMDKVVDQVAAKLTRG